MTKAEKHRLLASDAVHQHTVGTEKMRNQKNTRDGEYVGLRVGQVQVGLHVVGGDAHQIHKAHGEEAKHDRKELCQRRILSIFHAEDYYLLF